jgi:hypothetical protein
MRLERILINGELVEIGEQRSRPGSLMQAHEYFRTNSTSQKSRLQMHGSSSVDNLRKQINLELETDISEEALQQLVSAKSEVEILQ